MAKIVNFSLIPSGLGTHPPFSAAGSPDAKKNLLWILKKKWEKVRFVKKQQEKPSFIGANSTQGDQLNMAVLFWKLVKSDSSSVRYCSYVNWTSHCH